MHTRILPDRPCEELVDRLPNPTAALPGSLRLSMAAPVKANQSRRCLDRHIDTVLVDRLSPADLGHLMPVRDQRKLPRRRKRRSPDARLP